MEGKLQNAYKASYPPGDAREDWVIFKDLANKMKKPLEFKNIKNLRDSIKKIIQSKNDNFDIKIKKIDFGDDSILIKPLDYYYSNTIARSSKIMNECRQIKKKFTFRGIEKAS